MLLLHPKKSRFTLRDNISQKRRVQGLPPWDSSGHSFPFFPSGQEEDSYMPALQPITRKFTLLPTPCPQRLFPTKCPSYSTFTTTTIGCAASPATCCPTTPCCLPATSLQPTPKKWSSPSNFILSSNYRSFPVALSSLKTPTPLSIRATISASGRTGHFSAAKSRSTHPAMPTPSTKKPLPPMPTSGSWKASVRSCASTQSSSPPYRWSVTSHPTASLSSTAPICCTTIVPSC